MFNLYLGCSFEMDTKPNFPEEFFNAAFLSTVSYP